MPESTRHPTLELHLTAAARPFGWRERPAPSLRKGSRDRDGFLFPVDVRPAQCQVLTRPEASGEGEGKENAVAGRERVLKESSCLVGAQDAHLGSCGLGDLDAGGWIAVQKAPTHGLFERGVENSVGVANRSRRQLLLV